MRAIDVGFTGHGRELREPHRSPITSLEWSPDGSILATGSYDGTLKLWERRRDLGDDQPQLAVRHTFVHRRLVNGVRWSHGGRLLASSSADHSCRIWDIERLACVGVLVRHTDDVNSMAWSPDDSHLATVSEDGTGRFWRIDGEALENGIIVHEDHCMSVDWSPVQDLLATCGEDATIRLWNGRGKALAAWPQEGDLEMVRFSVDGQRIAATCDDGYVRVFELDGRCVATIGPVGQAVKSVSWSPDGRRLALGAYDATCTVWEIASGRLQTRFSGPRLWPRAVHWNPAGDQVAIGTLDDRPAVVDAGRAPSPATAAVEPGRPTASAPTVTLAGAQPTYGINAISPIRAEGMLLAVDDGQLWFWDLRQPDGEGGQPPAPLPGQAPGSESLVNTVAFNPQAKLVAYGTFKGGVRVRRFPDGTLLGSVEVEAPVNQVSWSPDGRTLAAADYRGRVTLLGWSEGRLERLRTTHLHEGAIKSVVWLSDSALVTGATDRLVKLSAPRGEVLQVFAGHGNLIDSVSVTSGAPAVRIASTSRDRTIRIWHPGSGRCERVLFGHDESLKSVAWKPASSTILLSGSYDFEARLWDLDQDERSLGFSTLLSYHRHGVGAVAWWGELPVTASWDTACVVWQPTPEGWRPQRVAMVTGAVRQRVASGVD